MSCIIIDQYCPLSFLCQPNIPKFRGEYFAIQTLLDSFISDFAGKKLDKGRDAQLTKIQETMLYATNPLTNLWAELIDQGLTQDSQAAIFVSDVLEIIQRTLVLLGNASNLISETR